MSKKAMKLALEALQLIKEADSHYATPKQVCDARALYEPTIKALEEVLAKQEQGEPVAIVDANDDGYWADILPDRSVKICQLLYTTPQQRKPLTFEQIEDCFSEGGIWGVDGKHFGTTAQGLHDFARAIEAAHGIRSKT